MNEASSTIDDHVKRRRIISWVLFPLALFPLLALMTYDWRAIPMLCNPPFPHTNWIGAAGDYFAYYGYLMFGLAIWIVPVLCVIAGLCVAKGRRMHLGRRELWFVVLLSAVAALFQVCGEHSAATSSIVQRLNLASAGGAVGYLLMTRLLSPLINDFGASVLMIVLTLVSIVAAIGAHNLGEAATAICQWAISAHNRIPRTAPKAPETDWTSSAIDNTPMPTTAPVAPPKPTISTYDPLRMAAQAKADARRIREEEKAAAKAAKDEAKRIREEEKAAAKAEKAAAKAAAKATPKPASGESAVEDDKGPYLLPPLSVLNPLKKSTADHGNVNEMAGKIIDTLKLFGIDSTLAYTVQGPVVTKYAITIAPGIKYSAVTNLSDNLMGSLHAKSLRIEAPIPGEESIGIEVPNKSPAGISFREIFESDAWRTFKGELPLLFGKNAAGKELIADLASMPHMLVAGATGQGKSVCLNSIINGLLMTKTPEQLKLIMVDPKSVEFTSYAAIPHLIVPIITENKKVAFSLRWAVQEMEKRLKLFARARVRNIYDFNHRLQFTQTDMFGQDSEVNSGMPKTVPYIVIIIDEVADLMSQCAKEVTPDISRLTAKARAAGIHLILATQRPDAKIITGTIKANIPGRVAFKTAQAIDSRTILDEAGAENLIGRGDMLFKGKDGMLTRAQGAWISDEEIANITRFIEQHSNTDFDNKFADKLSTIKEEEIDIFADPEDEKKNAAAEAQTAKEKIKAEENASDFKKALECVINSNRASISFFQRELGWGYNHSAKIVDMLEDAGVVGPQAGAGPRQIIMDQEQLLAIFNGEKSNGGEDAAATEADDSNTDVDSQEADLLTEEQT